MDILNLKIDSNTSTATKIIFKIRVYKITQAKKQSICQFVIFLSRTNFEKVWRKFCFQKSARTLGVSPGRFICGIAAILVIFNDQNI